MENRPVDAGSIQGSHRPISFIRIKHRTRANDNLCKCLMYHHAADHAAAFNHSHGRTHSWRFSTFYKIRTPHPQHPPLAESTWNLHKPQHPSTDNLIELGLGWGGSGRVVGVRRHGPKKTQIPGTKYVPGTMCLVPGILVDTKYGCSSSTFYRVLYDIRTCTCSCISK